MAALPMYDRPEIAKETDRLWALLREAIRDKGLDAPAALDRETPLRKLWSAPELVLAQSCGLPFVRVLASRVGLLGTPAYAIEGVAPGEYRSALIVSDGSQATGLAALRGARVAINAWDSQSGYAALMDATAPYAQQGRMFASVLVTGSHAASIEAVAAGRAHIAAIDAVTWALACRHDALTKRLRVLEWTAPTPGLPLITGNRGRVLPLTEAVEAVFAALPGDVSEALLIRGFRRRAPEDYTPIRERLAAALERHRLPTPL
ncbi:MAG: phosphate/phosphite/phosphonate ABC transporter substrate-binding protein [Pikeienuella sp.]